mgnify:CR=1 FL=1
MSTFVIDASIAIKRVIEENGTGPFAKGPS